MLKLSLQVAVSIISAFICISSVLCTSDDDGYYNKDDYTKDMEYKYWGAYLGLFGGLYIFMACISGTGYFDKFVEVCTLHAYQTKEAELLMDEETKKEIEVCRKFEAEHKKAVAEGKEDNQANLIPWYCCCLRLMASAYDEFPYGKKYHENFMKDMLNKRTYNGINFTEEETRNSCGCLGWLRKVACSCFGHKIYDMLFFICNNSPILSMALCNRAHPLSRAEKRNAFFVVNSFSLLFCILFLLITNAELKYGYSEREKQEFSIYWNIFLVVPLMTIVDKFMFYLQACPCLYFHASWKCCESIKEFLQRLSQIIGFSIALICIGIYFLDGYIAKENAWENDEYDSEKQGYEILGKYVYEIFVVSQGVSLFYTISHFAVGYYNFKIFGCIPIFTFGIWDLERVVHLNYRIN